MSKRSKVDWNLARALYHQGMTKYQVAKKLKLSYDTVKRRASRERWIVAQRQAEQTVLEGVNAAISQTIPELSRKVRQTLAEHLEKTALTLPEKPPPKNFSDIYSQQKAIEKLVNNSGKVFGWNDDSQARPSLVNIAILNQLKDGETVVECAEEIEPEPETGAHSSSSAQESPLLEGKSRERAGE